MRQRLVAIAVAPLLLVGLAACGEDQPAGPSDSASPVEMGKAISGVEVSGELGQEPEVEVDGPLKLEETQTQVIEAGDGGPVVEGEQALLHVSLINGTTGEEAAATYDQGTPFHVQQVSEGQLWPGVLEAIVDKPAGSRIAVAAVPEDAYGASGNPQLKIGPNDPVLFVVDVLSVQPTDVLQGPEGDPTEVPASVPEVEAKGEDVTKLDFSGAAKEPSDELQVIPLVEGTGPPARDDSLVTFDYFGQVYGTNSVFDESFSKQPVTFPLGIGGLIKGWDEGLVDVKEGSRVMLIVPPEQGYGEQGQPPKIPANATLTFVIDILGVDAPA